MLSWRLWQLVQEQIYMTQLSSSGGSGKMLRVFAKKYLQNLSRTDISRQPIGSNISLQISRSSHSTRRWCDSSITNESDVIWAVRCSRDTKYPKEMNNDEWIMKNEGFLYNIQSFYFKTSHHGNRNKNIWHQKSQKSPQEKWDTAEENLWYYGLLFPYSRLLNRELELCAAKRKTIRTSQFVNYFRRNTRHKYPLADTRFCWERVYSRIKGPSQNHR